MPYKAVPANIRITNHQYHINPSNSPAFDLTGVAWATAGLFSVTVLEVCGPAELLPNTPPEAAAAMNGGVKALPEVDELLPEVVDEPPLEVTAGA